MGVNAISPRASAQLTTLIGRESGMTRVTVAGELDIATSADFGTDLAWVIDEHGPDVLIDVSALTFCDARGLAAIVAADGLARRRGGRVALTGVRPQMARILRITRLDSKFTRPRAAATAGRENAIGLV